MKANSWKWKPAVTLWLWSGGGSVERATCERENPQELKIEVKRWKWKKWKWKKWKWKHESEKVKVKIHSNIMMMVRRRVSWKSWLKDWKSLDAVFSVLNLTGRKYIGSILWVRNILALCQILTSVFTAGKYSTKQSLMKYQEETSSTGDHNWTGILTVRIWVKYCFC